MTEKPDWQDSNQTVSLSPAHYATHHQWPNLYWRRIGSSKTGNSSTVRLNINPVFRRIMDQNSPSIDWTVNTFVRRLVSSNNPTTGAINEFFGRMTPLGPKTSGVVCAKIPKINNMALQEFWSFNY